MSYYFWRLQPVCLGITSKHWGKLCSNLPLNIISYLPPDDSVNWEKLEKFKSVLKLYFLSDCKVLCQLRLDSRMFYSGFQRFLLFWFEIFSVLENCEVTSQLAPHFLPPFYANWSHNNPPGSWITGPGSRGRESPEAGGAQSMYSGDHGALVFNASWEARMEWRTVREREQHLHKFQPLARLNKFSLGLCYLDTKEYSSSFSMKIWPNIFFWHF